MAAHTEHAVVYQLTQSNPEFLHDKNDNLHHKTITQMKYYLPDIEKMKLSVKRIIQENFASVTTFRS